MPPPRLATPRNLSRLTDGQIVAFLAFLHRRQQLRWQRYIADVLGEQLPTGRYAYPIGVVLVPRQTGKTTTAFDIAQGRCLRYPDYRAAYTAQTGHITTERFTERFGEITSTPLASRVKIRRSAGTERITFLDNGSYLKAFPPIDGSLRGSALDLVLVDEAQEHDDALGAALDRTIMPTFTTRSRRQLILLGTAGTTASGYLQRYLDLARSGAPGVAVFEWGARPGMDLDDETTWTATHPGLGQLTDLDALRAARQVLGGAGFAREYLNVWTAATSWIIDPAAWQTRADPDPVPVGAPAAVAFDMGLDRIGALVAAVQLPDGRTKLDVITHGDPAQLTARTVHVANTQPRPTVGVDEYGPARDVADAIARAGVPLRQLTSAEYAAACSRFVDRFNAGQIIHRGDPQLAAAVAAATTRTIGDGGFGWSRRRSEDNIAPLVAATVADWVLDHGTPAPFIV